MGEDSADKLFHWLCWVTLPTYPIAVYAAWGCTEVDHEEPPLWIFAPVPGVCLALHFCSRLFRWCFGGALMSWRRQAGGGQADIDRFLARSWKIVEVSCLSLLGWSIVSKQPFFPASLGGEGKSATMFPAGRRFVPMSLAAYLALRFAYLLEWWVFEDGLQRPSLTMHHIATSILLCCAVLLGWVKFGSMIVFIHDVWNVPLQILVWIQQVRCSSAFTIVAYLVSLYATFHLCFYCFVVEVIWPSISKEHAETTEWKVYWAMFAVLLVHHAHAAWRLLLYIPRFIKSPAGAISSAREKEGTHRD
eukprot:TRINITY_DN40051_c0_g1_i1.p1 TRINITY_DN40051_c0_g1~~TRINITY_DN40051_c0_g1_i1.p1  ORF type:complete len:304 (+),score=41.87 TRINITY_DN40051_c0_g1_i1:54-965(+)